MASLQELRTLFNDSDLLEKVEVATVIAANNLLAVTPNSAQKAWAATVFSNPIIEANKALMAVLAENSGLTVVQITGAADTAIQAGVDGVVDTLVDALAGV